jgi:sulfate adenylyltransferase large subunit
MELLRLATAGSVDDGKSTLIGRLLYDAKALMADEIESVGEDLSRLTDGLRAEREQGITIDVAWRHFATPRRRFILADCPGHAQYTRNMVTGASTADLALILVDVRNGLTEQSRRHATITRLLGVPHVVVAVNKMDLVDFSEEAFDTVVREFLEWAPDDAAFIPISALHGDNVVEPSARTPWYGGEPLLTHLESVPAAPPPALRPARLAVQSVIRDGEDRWYAGSLAAGVLRAGDEVVVLPSGLRTRVAEGGGEAPHAVSIRLEDELDVSRGDVIAHADDPPETLRELSATLCWMGDEPGRSGGRYLLKHMTRTVRARLDEITHRLDVVALTQEPATELALNDIAQVHLRLAEPIAADPYSVGRLTGAFILIDESSNETVAAGMID